MARLRDLPYDLPKAHGRNDILARFHPHDAHTYQLAATLGSHHSYGGFLGSEFERFARGHLEIARSSDLLDAFTESAWVYQHVQPGDTHENHRGMVNRWTRRWLEDRFKPGYGAIGQSRALFGQTFARISERREEIIARDPDEYRSYMRY